jgi:hypothetical protein
MIARIVVNMLKIKEIIRKYLKRNRKYLFSKNVLHEMNGVVLTNTDNALFDFHGKLADEVTKYCKDHEFDINKIVFLSSYEIEKHNKDNLHINISGDSNISIVEETNGLTAVVCIGKYISLNVK